MARARARRFPRPGSRRGQDDGAEELDGADGRQWQPVDGQVEQRIHGGQDGAQRQQDPALGNREDAEQPPGAAPEREDGSGGSDAQPGDAEHADVREQQDRERGTQVMEDGAGEEQDAGGRPVTARPALASRSDRPDAAAVPSVALLTLKESYRIRPRSE